MSGADGGFVLPANVDPPTFCMTLEVPDDPQYIASLAGALWELQFWYNWQRDSAHTAVPVTRLWRRLIQEAFDRINAGHLCPVPSFINVAEMEYEMSVCEQLRFQNGKLQGLCCGEWTDIAGQGDISIGGPEQHGGGAPQPTPGGGCQKYHAQFDAKSQYLVPTVVSAGDTLTFSNASGAGSDGTGRWSCPDGNQFFAGACVGGGIYTDAGDPAPTLPHESLIVKIGSTWYPASSGTITVLGGVSNSPITIQMNDASLGDNSGSYALDVEVCNNASTSWTHTLDFALGPQGFATITHAGEDQGVWVAGSGWQPEAGPINHYYNNFIGRSFAATTITSIAMTYSAHWTTNSVPGAYQIQDSPTSILVTIAPIQGADLVLSWTGSASLSQIILTLNLGAYAAGGGNLSGESGVISRVVITGIGADPFV